MVIPKEEEKKALECYGRVKNNPFPALTDIQMLFKVYNKWVFPSPKDINCSDCRRTIIHFWERWQSQTT